MRVTTRIVNEEGLHARPSTLIVNTANGYTSVITLTIGGRDADAKSILEVMMLVSPKGTEVEIAAEGEDAAAALDALLLLFEKGFGETVL
jgi:phosphocarrier protein HPr